MGLKIHDQWHTVLSVSSTCDQESSEIIHKRKILFASVVCGSGTASVASHFKLCLQPFWQAVSLKSSHERKLGTWLLSGKGCFGSRLEHLYSSVVRGKLSRCSPIQILLLSV